MLGKGGTTPVIIKITTHLHFIFDLLLSSQIFWKSKLKHMGVDITCFLQEKISWRYTNADLKISTCLYSYKYNTKISPPESYEFSSYLPAKFVFFLKSRLLFSVFYYYFCMFCKQTFRIFKVRISKKVEGVIMRNLRVTFFIWRQMYCKIFISALVYL